MLACCCNMKKVALKLLKYCDIKTNHISANGKTALILACSWGFRKVARELLENYPCCRKVGT